MTTARIVGGPLDGQIWDAWADDRQEVLVVIPGPSLPRTPAHKIGWYGPVEMHEGKRIRRWKGER